MHEVKLGGSPEQLHFLSEQAKQLGGAKNMHSLGDLRRTAYATNEWCEGIRDALDTTSGNKQEESFRGGRVQPKTVLDDSATSSGKQRCT